MHHRVPFLEVKLEVDKKPGRLTQMQRPFWFKKRRRRSWIAGYCSIGHHVKPHNVIKHFSQQFRPKLAATKIWQSWAICGLL